MRDPALGQVSGDGVVLHRHRQGYGAGGGWLFGPAATAAAAGTTAGAVAGTTAAAVGIAGSGRRGRFPRSIWNRGGPHLVFRDIFVLTLQSVFNLLELIPNLFLILFQTVRRFAGHTDDVNTGFLLDFLAQRYIRPQFHQHKAVDIPLAVGAADNVALTAGGILRIDLAVHGLPAGDGFCLSFARHRVRHAYRYRTLQDRQPGGPLVNDLHPSAGPADAYGHGRCTNIEDLVIIQRALHVEKQIACIQQNVQFLSALPDCDLTDGIHFHQLFVVQIDPRITGFLRLQAVAAAQGHPLRLLDAAATAVGNGDRPLGFHQPHDRRCS